MRALMIPALLVLASCSTTSAERPEPEVRTVEIKVPVVQPCPALEALGPSPDYPDSDTALAAAPNLYERVKLLIAGRLLRMTREANMSAIVQACR